MGIMKNQLLDIKPNGNGIAEMIYISCNSGDFYSPVIFIRDQIKGGHRDKMVEAVGEKLVNNIEKLYLINQ